jgi:hypothetical protein
VSEASRKAIEELADRQVDPSAPARDQAVKIMTDFVAEMQKINGKYSDIEAYFKRNPEHSAPIVCLLLNVMFR